MTLPIGRSGLLYSYRESMKDVPEGGVGFPIAHWGVGTGQEVAAIDPSGAPVDLWLPALLDEVAPDWIGLCVDTVYRSYDTKNPEDVEYIRGEMQISREAGDPSVHEAIVVVLASPEKITFAFQPYSYADGERIWEEPTLGSDDETGPGVVSDILHHYFEKRGE